KGNDGFRPGSEVQAADLAVLVVENFLAVGEEGVTGKKIARENGFLIVARDGIAHPAVFSRFQIAQAQAGFRLVTGCVQQLLSIRRKHGAETAAQLFQEDILVTGFAITACNLPKGKLRVVGERTGSARVIEIFTVWRSHDTQGVGAFTARLLRRRFRLGDLNAGASLYVIHPEFISGKGLRSF